MAAGRLCQGVGARHRSSRCGLLVREGHTFVEFSDWYLDPHFWDPKDVILCEHRGDPQRARVLPLHHRQGTRLSWQLRDRIFRDGTRHDTRSGPRTGRCPGTPESSASNMPGHEVVRSIGRKAAATCAVGWLPSPGASPQCSPRMPRLSPVGAQGLCGESRPRATLMLAHAWRRGSSA